MWIGIIFIAMVGLYLIRCLFTGKILLTMGLYFPPQARTIDRASTPKTFWIVWTITAAGLALFTFFFIRTVSS